MRAALILVGLAALVVMELGTPPRKPKPVHEPLSQTTVGSSVSRDALDPRDTLTPADRLEIHHVRNEAPLQPISPIEASVPLVQAATTAYDPHPSLKIEGQTAEFAAGDVAWFAIDGTHSCVMSCQHGRPMGRFAGHNVVCDLLGEPMLPLTIDWYTTILDLGAWGAVYTEGWGRQVVAQGTVAKRTKETINQQRIYPPLSRDRQEIFAAAAPIVQTPPAYALAAAAQ